MTQHIPPTKRVWGGDGGVGFQGEYRELAPAPAERWVCISLKGGFCISSIVYNNNIGSHIKKKHF